MIPLVGFKKELICKSKSSTASPSRSHGREKTKFNYLVGTMIEMPRGALTADEIAETAEFFSFGTNDLTQTCLGMSRDDSGSFPAEIRRNWKSSRQNPFATIDQAASAQLMKIAVEKGRKTRPDIKLGICGEHGGDRRFREILPQASDWPMSVARPSACRSRAWRPRRLRWRTAAKDRRRKNKIETQTISIRI
jgi:pyruvate,orthophosphate dikinase